MLAHSLSTYLKDTDHRPDSPLNPQETEPMGGERLRTGMSQFSVANVKDKSWGERLPRGRIFEWVLKEK